MFCMYCIRFPEQSRHNKTFLQNYSTTASIFLIFGNNSTLKQHKVYVFNVINYSLNFSLQSWKYLRSACELESLESLKLKERNYRRMNRPKMIGDVDPIDAMDILDSLSFNINFCLEFPNLNTGISGTVSKSWFFIDFNISILPIP